MNRFNRIVHHRSCGLPYHHHHHHHHHHRTLSSIRAISTLTHLGTENYTTTTLFPSSLDSSLSRLFSSHLKKPISFFFFHLTPYSTSRLFHASAYNDYENKDNIRVYRNKETTTTGQCQESLQCDTTEEIETDDWEEEEEEEEEEELEADGWEEDDDDDVEPQVGDGGDGGGVVLQGVRWGERALSMAREVLLQFGDDLKLFAFKTTPRGYIYVRLDKLSNQYGCPSMEELESYSQEYKKRLDEVGALGEIPDNLALEVSSPSAERLLKVPDDLSRFNDIPMRVSYLESLGSNCQEHNGIFYLESMDMDSKNCVWKLADVKENRDPESKGRPLSRKRRDWRLQLSFEMHKKVTLYVEL